jgi:hypothetical protein
MAETLSSFLSPRISGPSGEPHHPIARLSLTSQHRNDFANTLFLFARSTGRGGLARNEIRGFGGQAAGSIAVLLLLIAR